MSDSNDQKSEGFSALRFNKRLQNSAKQLYGMGKKALTTSTDYPTAITAAGTVIGLALVAPTALTVIGGLAVANAVVSGAEQETAEHEAENADTQDFAQEAKPDEPMADPDPAAA